MYLFLAIRQENGTFTKKKNRKKLGTFCAPFRQRKRHNGKGSGTLEKIACIDDGRRRDGGAFGLYEGGHDNEDGNDTPNPEPQYAGADTMTLRVVGDGENGTLILAGETEVYALPLEGVTLYLDGGSVSASEIESGHERRGLVHRRRAGDISCEVFTGGGRVALA